MRKKWYSVKTFYRSKSAARGILFEERVVLFKANTLDGAIKLAEKEAAQYESSWKNSNGKKVSIVYTGYCDAYELVKAPLEGREVFSSTSFYEAGTTVKKMCNDRMGPVLTKTRKAKMSKEFF